jgi:hypothetical protein
MRKSSKVSLLTLLAVLGFSAAAFAFSAGLEFFNGRTDGETISLEWRSGVEAGLKNYSIERTPVKPQEFQEIGTVAATGPQSTYRFRDVHPNAAAPVGAYGGNAPMSDMFQYRLRMNFNDGGVSYSQIISVSRPSSGVKRTWGMIKEMFH